MTRLTIGTATRNEFDGCYFTVQAAGLYHPEVSDVEFVVVDNDPNGPCADALRALASSKPNLRYIPCNDLSGSAVIRNVIFEHAQGEVVLVLDSHVLVAPGGIAAIMAYFDARPGCRDLVQGPLLSDDLESPFASYKLEWHAGYFGRWGVDPRGSDVHAPPFEIEMQGLGLFACRKDAWVGFNPGFSGYGGAEGYIHEKFRRAGGRVMCLPAARWIHRHARPNGLPYAMSWEDRIRNYLIGYRELDIDPSPMEEHMRAYLGDEAFDRIYTAIKESLS